MGISSKLATLMLVGTMAQSLLILPARAGGNVDVEADSMEIIDADKKTIFRGNVLAKRPTDTIKADEMIVVSSAQKQADGTVKTVTDHVDANGNVSIHARNAVITGAWANFDVLGDKLTVGGDEVKVVQGASVIKGKKLDVDLKNFHLNMSGGRVNASIVP